jgi:hypothetical protein
MVRAKVSSGLSCSQAAQLYFSPSKIFVSVAISYPAFIPSAGLTIGPLNAGLLSGTDRTKKGKE